MSGYDHSKVQTEQHHAVISQELYEFEPPALYRDGSCLTLTQSQDSAPTKEPSQTHCHLPDRKPTAAPPAAMVAYTSHPQRETAESPADISLLYTLNAPIEDTQYSVPTSVVDRSLKDSPIFSLSPTQVPGATFQGSEPGSAQTATSMSQKSSPVTGHSFKLEYTMMVWRWKWGKGEAGSIYSLWRTTRWNKQRPYVTSWKLEK